MLMDSTPSQSFIRQQRPNTTLTDTTSMDLTQADGLKPLVKPTVSTIADNISFRVKLRRNESSVIFGINFGTSLTD